MTDLQDESPAELVVGPGPSPQEKKKKFRGCVTTTVVKIRLFLCRICQEKMGSIKKLIVHLDREHNIQVQGPASVVDDDDDLSEAEEENAKLSRLLHDNENKPREQEPLSSSSSESSESESNSTDSSDDEDEDYVRMLSAEKENKLKLKAIESFKKLPEKKKPARTCSICFVEFLKDELFLYDHHMKKHEHGRMNACPHCSMTFELEYHLNVHLRDLQPTIEDVQLIPVHRCSVPDCIKEFSNRKCLLFHKTQHDKLHRCPTCEKPFYNVSVMRHHHHKVHNKQKRRVPCLEPNCGKHFTTRRGLKQHHSSTHRPNNWINRLTALPRSRAKKRKHALWSGYKPWSKVACPYCRLLFAGHIIMNKHMSDDHNINVKEERPFSCEICHASFNKLNYYTRHMNIMHPTRMKVPYSKLIVKKKKKISDFADVEKNLNVCDQEDKTISQQGLQPNSNSEDSERNIVTRKGSMSRRTSSTSDDYNKNPSMSETDDKSSYTASESEPETKRTFKRKKPGRKARKCLLPPPTPTSTPEGMFYVCEFCPLKYKYNFNLTRHIQTNHGEDSDDLFKCPYCPVSCKTGSRVTLHVNKYHPEVKQSTEEATKRISETGVSEEQNENVLLSNAANPVIKIKTEENTDQLTEISEDRESSKTPSRRRLLRSSSTSSPVSKQFKLEHEEFEDVESHQSEGSGSYSHDDDESNLSEEPEKTFECPGCLRKFETQRGYLIHSKRFCTAKRQRRKLKRAKLLKIESDDSNTTMDTKSPLSPVNMNSKCDASEEVFEKAPSTVSQDPDPGNRKDHHNGQDSLPKCVSNPTYLQSDNELKINILPMEQYEQNANSLEQSNENTLHLKFNIESIFVDNCSMPKSIENPPKSTLPEAENLDLSLEFEMHEPEPEFLNTALRPCTPVPSKEQESVELIQTLECNVPATPEFDKCEIGLHVPVILYPKLSLVDCQEKGLAGDDLKTVEELNSKENTDSANCSLEVQSASESNRIPATTRTTGATTEVYGGVNRLENTTGGGAKPIQGKPIIVKKSKTDNQDTVKTRLRSILAKRIRKPTWKLEEHLVSQFLKKRGHTGDVKKNKKTNSNYCKLSAINDSFTSNRNNSIKQGKGRNISNQGESSGNKQSVDSDALNLKQIKCSYCGRVYSKKEYLNRHVSKFHRKKQMPLSMKKEKKQQNANLLPNHNVVKSLVPKTYSCNKMDCKHLNPYCNIEHLNLHTRYTHSEESQLLQQQIKDKICPECERKFANPGNTRTHIQSQHLNGKLLFAPTPNTKQRKSLNDIIPLNLPQTININTKLNPRGPFTCNAISCEKLPPYTEFKYLNLHNQYMHSEDSKRLENKINEKICPQCEKVFTSVSNTRQHIRYTYLNKELLFPPRLTQKEIKELKGRFSVSKSRKSI